jgi:hypothetical protein
VVADRACRAPSARDGAALNTVPLVEGAGAANADLVVRNGTALVVTTSGRLFSADPRAGRVTEITYGGGG